MQTNSARETVMDILKHAHSVLNGIEYRNEPSKEIIQFLEENNLIVIQGQSDDILDMYGRLSEQFGANNGFDYENSRHDGFNEEEFKILEKCQVKLHWCPDETRSWKAEASKDIPQMEFEVLEEGRVFCTALILDISSIIT